MTDTTSGPINQPTDEIVVAEARAYVEATQERYGPLPASVSLRHIVGLLATIDERDVALAEIARMSAPPGADAMEHTRRYMRCRPHCHQPLDEPCASCAILARVIQQYGDERAREAIEVAEIGPARTERDGILYREGWAAAIEEAEKLVDEHSMRLKTEIHALATKPGSKT